MSLTAPDSSFMKKLKALDPKLDCKFQGPVPNKFVITYERPLGDPATIWLVEDDNGGFRKPDERDIETLKASDVHREDIKTRFRKVAKYAEDYKAERDRKVEEGIRDRTKDDYVQLRRAIDRVDNPKAMSGVYRKIKHKPKGKKTEDIGKPLS